MGNFCGLACNFIHNATYFLVGMLFWIIILLFAVLSTPVYIYRYLITKVVAPCFRPSIGKVVSVNGQIHASEFAKLPKDSTIPPKLAIVANLVFEGILSLEKVTQLIESRWIQARLSNGKLKYPEFQQHIDSWMGFMFFKEVKNFHLKDHIFLHKLNDSSTEEEGENYLRILIENLVNKPFPFNKSPWEVHLIQNYRNSQLDCVPGQMSTVFILRIHHGMGDGFAMMHVIVETLLGSSFNEIGLAMTKPPIIKQTKRNIFQQLWRTATFPIKVLRNFGYTLTILLREKTSWHILGSRKTGRQIYGRSPLIPIEKLKFIKNRLGVTLSSVLIACTTGASAEMMSRSMNNPPARLTTCFPVAIDRNRNKLRNNAAGVVIDVPCSPNMDIISRLRECESEVQKIKKSVDPLLARIVLIVFSSQFAKVTRYLTQNRYMCLGVSNFPGPGVQINLDGMAVLAIDCITGGLDGQTGVTFTIVSYNGSIRICAVAENAILTNDEMNELIDKVCLMIDKLHVMSENYKEYEKISMQNE